MKEVKKKPAAKKESTGKKNQLQCLAKGLGIAYAITAIVFIVYAIILTYTNVTDKHVGLIAVICTVAASAVCGFDSAKAADSKGIIWGMIAGICYAAILFIIGFFVIGGAYFDAGKLITLLVATAGGGIGGIFGINTK